MVISRGWLRGMLRDKHVERVYFVQEEVQVISYGQMCSNMLEWWQIKDNVTVYRGLTKSQKSRNTVETKKC